MSKVTIAVMAVAATALVSACGAGDNLQPDLTGARSALAASTD